MKVMLGHILPFMHAGSRFVSANLQRAENISKIIDDAVDESLTFLPQQQAQQEEGYQYQQGRRRLLQTTVVNTTVVSNTSIQNTQLDVTWKDNLSAIPNNLS